MAMCRIHIIHIKLQYTGIYFALSPWLIFLRVLANFLGWIISVKNLILYVCSPDVHNFYVINK